MLQSLHALDAILRGRATDPDRLNPKTFEVPLAGLSALLLVLGALHGLCVGSYALFNHHDPGWLQALATTAKVPALFALTLLVTFPSLYVFNALVGSRLELGPLLRLLVASQAVTLAVLASFGPIVAFFSASTTSYRFMVLLNVVVFALAGLLGLKFLRQTLQRLTTTAVTPLAPSDPDRLPDDLGALDPAPGPQVLTAHVRTVFRTWMLLFGLVGAQMAWVLRPFVGDPARPFTLFRARESNFFAAVWDTLLQLLAG